MLPRLDEVHDLLYGFYGPQHWWPGDTGFEIIVGALLTQQTSWSAVEKAIGNLKRARLLAPIRLAEAKPSVVQRCIRCTGFYRQKARAVQEMARYIARNYEGSVEKFLRGGMDEKRAELLGRRGVGCETADSILLYAKGAPTFVVDSYTHRLFDRLGYPMGRGYEGTRRFFEANLPREVQLYKEFHALIDVHCKTRCLRKPLCDGCPLTEICPYCEAFVKGEANLIKH